MKKLVWLLALLPAIAFSQSNEANLSQLGIRPSSGTPGNFALHWPATGLPSWIADTGAPGGTSGQVQYNNAGSFGGISNVSGGILIGQASGAPVFYATSGDCTISATGVVSCTKINGLTFPALVSGDCLTNNGTALSWGTCGTGSGTVTSFSFTNGNGFTGTVSTPTTTPALSLTMSSLSAIPAISAYSFLANATNATASPAAVQASSAVMADIQANTTFTVAGTGCTPPAHTGGPFAGTVTLAATCTALTITMNGVSGFTAPNGWHCNVEDRTAMAAGTNWIPAWGESASTTTTATLPIPSAAGATDVISFGCTYF